jgi:hypothetical protein
VARDRASEGVRRLEAFLGHTTPPAKDGSAGDAAGTDASDAAGDHQRGGATRIRDEVLAAAESLTAQGSTPFSPADVIAEARRMGSTASAPTIRTGVVQNMRVDTGALTSGRGFAKVGRSKYVLAGPADPDGSLEEAAATAPAMAPPPPPPPPPAPALSYPPVATGAAQPVDPPADWFWKGNVQSAVVRVLVADGWDIVRVAHTASEEDGIDIEARKDGQRLVVEVTGHPGTTSSDEADGAGSEPTGSPALAKAWFSSGIVSALAVRGDDPSARVVAAFPDLPTYQHLAPRVAGPLLTSGIEIWLIDEHGTPTNSEPSSDL